MNLSIVDKVVVKQDIIKELINLGVKPGMTVEVHASLKSFGYVVGGAQTVVDAIMEVVGYDGGIIMALQTSSNSEPSRWENPAIQPEYYQKVRESIPPFHKKDSSSDLGAIVDNFRRRDGVFFSNHPRNSFVAWGKSAKMLCNMHSLHFSLSEESPNARIYEYKGHILLLGVGLQSATSLHLSEYRSGCRPIQIEGSMVEIDGRVEWKKYLDIDLDSSCFPKIEPLLRESNHIRTGMIGECEAMLLQAEYTIGLLSQLLEQQTIYNYYK